MECLGFETKTKMEQMAYPARLEVTTLLNSGESGNDDQVGQESASGLPPVVDTDASPTRRAVFIISETTKRPRSAGVLGTLRVTPAGMNGVPSRCSTAGTACFSVSQRARSSPCIGRRCTKVMPLPPTTHLQQPTDNKDCRQGYDGQKNVPEFADGDERSSKLPKWKRERRKESERSSNQDSAALWPTSSLDSGPIEQGTTPTNSSTPGNLLSLPDRNSRSMAGMYTVPIISIATDYSYPARSGTSLEHSHYVTERIHTLVRAFSQRASRVKAQITQPPTPSIDLSDAADDAKKASNFQRLDSLVPSSSRSPSANSLIGINTRRARFLRKVRACRKVLRFPQGMEPQSRLYISWLLIVSITYVYNAWVIPLRSVFSEYQTDDNLKYWMVFDYIADFVYVLDIILFQSRIKYLDNGFWVDTPSLMKRYYAKTTKFRYDLVSLLPLDFLYFKFGPISIFRLPRLLKLQTFWEFFNRMDTVLSSPHAVRVVRTVLYMLYLIHLNTCAYYGFSKIEGIGSNKWVFQGIGNAYIRCFYFATKTATSIGKNPKPENEAEYLFMTCSWLMGVFVFALLIGQIRDIVATATRNQNEYRKVMDQTLAYLHRLNVPPSLQDRVRLWFTYTWHNQKTLNEMKCLESLPRKMRTDLAISVHIQTLSKVQLFQDCDKALLRDLVLKLRPVLYLPGDYVCKKGEVGKEMYIVQAGQVLVMGGEKGDMVLATLGEGSVFGEISLLALAGGNRRTANVRSRGFSSLFVLSKADLQATIKDYPEAQEILKKKAKRLIRQNLEREKKKPKPDDNVIIKSRESTPRLLHAVLQVVRPDSYTATVIRRSSRSFSRSTFDIPSIRSNTSADNSLWTPTSHQWSSSSIEIPSRSSRRSAGDSLRSSLEVPSSSRHWGGPKTSMSESLAEEEEEEFLVVETSEMCNTGPPGSPASCRSQPSISIQRSSQPSTPHSTFTHSTDNSLSSSPGHLQQLQEQDISDTDGIHPNTSRCPGAVNYSLSEVDLQRAFSRGQLSSGMGSDMSDRMSPSSLHLSSSTSYGGHSCASTPDDNVFQSPPDHKSHLSLLSKDFQNSCTSQPVTTSDSCRKDSSVSIGTEVTNRNGSGKIKGMVTSSEKEKQKHETQYHCTGSHINLAYESEGKPEQRVRNHAPLTPVGEQDFDNDDSQKVDTKGETGNRKAPSVLLAPNPKLSRHSGSLKSRKNENSKSGKTSRGNSTKISVGLADPQRCETRKHSDPTSLYPARDPTHLLPPVRKSSGRRKHSATNRRQSSAGQPLKSTENHESGAGVMQTRSTRKHYHAPTKSDSGQASTQRGNEYSISINDEVIMKQHGLSNSIESGIIPDTVASGIHSRGSLTSADSYDIFLSELSKTMPLPTSQGLSSSKISCSAIVHRECSPSPDKPSSPFDAQESKL